MILSSFPSLRSPHWWDVIGLLLAVGCGFFAATCVQLKVSDAANECNLITGISKVCSSDNVQLGTEPDLNPPTEPLPETLLL